MKLSVVIPAKNESIGLDILLAELNEVIVGAELDGEIIVVNDGSTDETSAVCAKHGATEVFHPYSKGNGAAVKSGARAARGEVIVFLDGDGQHKAADVPRLLEKLGEGYDMVVGARGSSSQADSFRAIGNAIYNKLSSMLTGHKILDLTSGFRAVRRSKFLQFLYLLPNGFSYPTTCTMAFFRAGYSVAYLPIKADKRIGNSHLSVFKDGIRFLIIIFKVGTLYSPLKIFLPVSLGFFSLGFSYYLYTYISDGRFTNMGVVLFVSAIFVFLIGLVSEQITTLMYKDEGND